jgi:hypothetical protein
MILIQVTLPHLCAGVIAKGDEIIRAAPILGWSVGKRPSELAAWVLSKGGRIAVVDRFGKR